ASSAAVWALLAFHLLRLLRLGLFERLLLLLLADFQFQIFLLLDFLFFF
ncbi:hypothetical protein ANHYDRO_00281, partial [Anaerococcus hydrogenalis DSM 7454]